MKPNNHNKNLLLLGSAGLLGSYLSKYLKISGYNFYTHSLTNDTDYNVDLTSFHGVNELIIKTKPRIILNLVALTDVDLCEREPNKSYLLNVRTVENIVAAIKKSAPKCHLIHISTDQVYDGIGLNNESNICLRNYYAYSKYAAELCALNVSSTILRTNFFGRSLCKGRSSFTDWIFNSLHDKKSIKVFNDILFSPLSIASLSRMIELCIEKKPVGIYNLGSSSSMSKAEFAQIFASKCGLSINLLRPVSINNIDFLYAFRPRDMRLNCSLFEKKVNIKLPSLIDEIDDVVKEYV